MEGDDDKILYVGVDMESIDNNCSMSMEPIINMGFSAAFADGVELASLSVNLIPGTPGDPDTLTWFKEKNLEAYEASTKDPVPPEEGMKIIQSWFNALPPAKDVILVFYPTIYDGSWLYHYWFKYLGNPVAKGPPWKAIDIRSYTMGVLDIPYSETSVFKDSMKPYLPPKDAVGLKHTGLDDARYQLKLFLNLLLLNKQTK